MAFIPARTSGTKPSCMDVNSLIHRDTDGFATSTSTAATGSSIVDSSRPNPYRDPGIGDATAVHLPSLRALSDGRSGSEAGSVAPSPLKYHRDRMGSRTPKNSIWPLSTSHMDNTAVYGIGQPYPTTTVGCKRPGSPGLLIDAPSAGTPEPGPGPEPEAKRRRTDDYEAQLGRLANAARIALECCDNKQHGEEDVKGVMTQGQLRDRVDRFDEHVRSLIDEFDGSTFNDWDCLYRSSLKHYENILVHLLKLCETAAQRQTVIVVSQNHEKKINAAVRRLCRQNLTDLDPQRSEQLASKTNLSNPSP